MTSFKNYTIILSLIFIISCSTSYNKLTDNNFNISDEFSKNLFDAYKEKAVFEAEKMHDWNSTKLYSEKAINAIEGEKILPQKISYWKIQPDKRLNLIMGYNNLMTIYDEAIIIDPYNLAISISSLDCWAEQQEENWQTWDINKCRDDFLKAIHHIYDSLDEKNQELKNLALISKNNDISKKLNNSATILTQDKQQNILQIVYFDFDKSNLTSFSIKEIENFININKETTKKYIIVGHTDTVGTEKYNNQLSIERADAVKNILIKNGIKKIHIKILGKGEYNLKVQTVDEMPHPANRRAEISPLN